jgi:hypothetical protein
MKVKQPSAKEPVEDPETKARREIAEARAEALKTTQLQRLLKGRSRTVARVFGRAQGGGFAAQGGSGASGVPAYMTGFGQIGSGFGPGFDFGEGGFRPRVGEYGSFFY